MACSCCYERAIIYGMKEDLLDATKKVDSPSGVDEGLWERYLNQIRGSGGFDLNENNYPKGSIYATLSIVKFQRDDDQDLTYKHLCKISSKALEWMAENKIKKGKGFKLVDVVKANELQGGMGIRYSYFITFKAKKNGIVKEFQTEAECRPQVNEECLFTDRIPPVVKFCRLKSNRSYFSR